MGFHLFQFGDVVPVLLGQSYNQTPPIRRPEAHQQVNTYTVDNNSQYQDSVWSGVHANHRQIRDYVTGEEEGSVSGRGFLIPDPEE